MGGDVEQADGVAGEDMVIVAADAGAVVLPADAADAEAGDLVAALAAEQPGQRDRADQLKRVGAPVRRRKVLGGSRFSPAQSSLAQMSSAITRGSGPSRRLDAARGSQRVREGRTAAGSTPIPGSRGRRSAAVRR